MGPLRDPFVAVWAGIDPSRNRLMIRMGLGGFWEDFGISDFRGVPSETSF